MLLMCASVWRVELWRSRPQHVQSAQERPDVDCRDESSFDVADDLLQFAAVTHGRAGDEAFGGEPLLELNAATRGPRAIEEPDEVLESVFVPRSVTSARRSWAFEKCEALKSLQKSVTDCTHCWSDALTVKLRFTWPARLRDTPPNVPTTKKSSVCQPRRSVWKLTSTTVLSIAIGGIAPTRSCASQ